MRIQLRDLPGVREMAQIHPFWHVGNDPNIPKYVYGYPEDNLYLFMAAHKTKRNWGTISLDLARVEKGTGAP